MSLSQTFLLSLQKIYKQNRIYT
ncbi:MAG: DUF1563 domain-containing protein [Bacteroidales bacterium]